MEGINVKEINESYFKEINKFNEKVLNNDPESVVYYSRCRNAISHYLKDLRISDSREKDTIGRMFNMDVGIGCEECIDIGRYVNAILDGDERTKDEINEKYYRRNLLILRTATEEEDPESVLNMPGTEGMLRMSDLDPEKYGDLHIVTGYYNGRYDVNDQSVSTMAIEKDRIIMLDREIRKKFSRLSGLYPIEDDAMNIASIHVFERDTGNIIKNTKKIKQILF